MDIDFFASVEQILDDHRMRIEALENALTQLPGIEFQPDPSRLPGVRIEPAPAPIIGVPNG
jgi:hypothetical protein